MKHALVAILLSSTSAWAAPFVYETGLPSFPAVGQPATLGAPITADGVESPYTHWRKLAFGVQGDAFITYQLRYRQDELFTQFELTRLQLCGWAAYDTWAGVNVTLETVRSSSSASYIGVDGDSLLPRLKYAFAEATPLKQWLVIRAGIIPDQLLPWAETAWTFRVLGTMGIERDGMFPTGDLGASVEAALPAGYGSIAASYTNGEGVHLREQNNGKNTTVAAHLRPLGRRLPTLILHLLYRDGSIGPGSAADRRLAGGFTYEGRRVGAGAIGTWAMGWNGLGARDAGHLMVFARGELPLRFYLFGRVDALWPDTNEARGVQLRLVGGLAYALPALVRIVVSYEGTLPFGSLVDAVPAVKEHDFLAQVEARL